MEEGALPGDTGVAYWSPPVTYSPSPPYAEIKSDQVNIKFGLQGENLRRIAQGLRVCMCLLCQGEGEPHGLYLWAKVTVENPGKHPPDSSEKKEFYMATL